MAEEKKEKKKHDENTLGKIVDKMNGQMADEMEGRPYLFVVATGYELEKEGDTSKFAPQWSWRTNVYLGKEDGKKLMVFLSNQLQEVVEHPERGVKKQYKLD